MEDYKEKLKYFKKKLPTNQFDLARECVEQPSLYEEVGEWVSSVKKEAKLAKEHVEFVRSDLSLKIRKNPTLYGLEEKLTEGSINSVIVTSEEYKQALERSIELDEFAYVASILLSSVEQRKSMIRDLVRLFVFNYYSSSDVLEGSWKENEKAILNMRGQNDEREDEEIVEEE